MKVRDTQKANQVFQKLARLDDDSLFGHHKATCVDGNAYICQNLDEKRPLNLLEL